jgi:hypothetical protein
VATARFITGQLLEVIAMDAPKGWIMIEKDFITQFIMTITVSLTFTIYLVTAVIVSDRWSGEARMTFLAVMYLIGMLTFLSLGMVYRMYRPVEERVRTVCALGIDDTLHVVERQMKERGYEIKRSPKREVGMSEATRIYRVLDSHIRIELDDIGHNHVSILIGPYTVKDEPKFDVLLNDLHDALKVKCDQVYYASCSG